MRRLSVKKIIKVSVSAALLVGFIFVVAKGESLAAPGKDTVEIVFSTDIHSYLDHYVIDQDGVIEDVGGVARLSSLIKQKKAINPELLVLDGGDIAMGTLYQTRFSDDAIEYRALGMAGVDATTFGNHDFDYGSEGLAGMFDSAAASGDPIPSILVCNIDWSSDNAGSMAIHDAAAKCGLAEYEIVEKNGYKIAVFGLFGKDAIDCAPTCELTVLDQIEAAQNTVEKIKANENPDMIVCLSHGGTTVTNVDDSEDALLAKEVPDIDVIVSGHAHLILDEPLRYGDTYIVSCGCYGVYTGDCVLSQNADGRWNVDSYENIRMNSQFEEDPEILAFLEGFDDDIDRDYVSRYGYQADDLIAVNENIDFEEEEDVYFQHTEMKLGNLMADAYRYAANETSGGKEHPADVAVVPSGTVRGSFIRGDIFVADAFQCYSLGMGDDGYIGHPLIKFYLTGKELKTVAEVDATLSDLMPSARLYTSGLNFSYNPHRMIMNKANDIWLSPGLMEDSRVEIDDDRLYCVVTDLYTGSMLGSVSNLSYGIISLEPKDIDGNPIPKDENGYIWDSIIVKNDDGSQIKTWVAIASYLDSFEENSEGISAVPEYYNEYHNRKVVDDSYSPKSLFKNTNGFFWGIIGIIVIVIAIVILLVLLLIKIIKRIIRHFGNRAS